MIVGKKHSARRHCVFRVMYVHGLLICGDARHQMSVRGRSWIRIDHREKVVALVRWADRCTAGRSRVASPGEQVVARCCLLLLLRMHRSIDAPNKQRKGEQKT